MQECPGSDDYFDCDNNSTAVDYYVRSDAQKTLTCNCGSVGQECMLPIMAAHRKGVRNIHIAAGMYFETYSLDGNCDELSFHGESRDSVTVTTSNPWTVLFSLWSSYNGRPIQHDISFHAITFVINPSQCFFYIQSKGMFFHDVRFTGNDTINSEIIFIGSDAYVSFNSCCINNIRSTTRVLDVLQSLFANFTNSVFEDVEVNERQTRGSVIQMTLSNLAVSGCEFRRCTSIGDLYSFGGAIYAEVGTNLRGSTFFRVENTSFESCGTFARNESANTSLAGGAVYVKVDTGGTFLVTATNAGPISFSNCSAGNGRSFGGGVYLRWIDGKFNFTSEDGFGNALSFDGKMHARYGSHIFLAIYTVVESLSDVVQPDAFHYAYDAVDLYALMGGSFFYHQSNNIYPLGRFLLNKPCLTPRPEFACPPLGCDLYIHDAEGDNPAFSECVETSHTPENWEESPSGLGWANFWRYAVIMGTAIAAFIVVVVVVIAAVCVVRRKRMRCSGERTALLSEMREGVN